VVTGPWCGAITPSVECLTRRPSTLASGCSAPRETSWPHSAFAHSTRYSFLFCDVLSSRSHTHIMATQLTLRLDVVSCESSRTLSWPVVPPPRSTLSDTMWLRLSRRRSFLPTLSHRSTLHTRARGAQRVERRGHVHSAGPPSLLPHSHPAHGHAPSSIAEIHMRIVVAVRFYPPFCLSLSV
jgi:hypothetical protein